MFEMLLKWFVLDYLSHSFFMFFHIHTDFHDSKFIFYKDFVDKDCIVMKLKLWEIIDYYLLFIFKSL